MSELGEGGSNARCPRCGGGFHCGAQDGHCDCFDVQLGDVLREQVRAQYGGMECLCVRCLRELKVEAQMQAPLG